MRKRKRNHTREAVLEVVRHTERVCEGLWDVLANEVQDDESKRRIQHFTRGVQFVLKQLRKR